MTVLRPEKRRKVQNKENLHISQMLVEWIHKSPTAIFSQPILLLRFEWLFFEKES